MKIDLDELKLLHEAATPGPWKFDYGDIVQLTDAGLGFPPNFYPGCATIVESGDGYDGTRKGVHPDHEHDAVLMVAARNALPALLARAAVYEAADDAIRNIGKTEDGHIVIGSGYYTALRAALAAVRKEEKGE